jgi:hypothetical protein
MSRVSAPTGYELLQELRDRLGEELPVIFVSGERVDAYDRIAGLLLGAARTSSTSWRSLAWAATRRLWRACTRLAFDELVGRA